jgi:hypothetical protein
MGYKTTIPKIPVCGIKDQRKHDRRLSESPADISGKLL